MHGGGGANTWTGLIASYSLGKPCYIVSRHLIAHIHSVTVATIIAKIDVFIIIIIL